ncbi:hypothetical protein HZS_8136 [Henneguya salminicola]|nr:hypothetical protein HZS_8136 [Henneguya salminicola]
MQESYLYEDEDSKIKLQECIELLITAGYYKAMIKSMDIVGGMIWCLSVTAANIDTNLLFIENLTIKEKM